MESQHDRNLAWGLNLDDPDATTQGEINEFRRISSKQFGMQQDSFEFWLEHRPDVLKRYRKWADALRIRLSGEDPNIWTVNTIGVSIFYAMTGFERGLEYTFHILAQTHTKDQFLDTLALIFRYVGPRGMATAARAARDQVWTEPVRPIVWPDGWAPDPDAFTSGADFRTRVASAEDIRRIVAWYERWTGEVPSYVLFLAKRRPDLLKAYRDRYEHTLRVLPKQTEPYVLIQTSVQRGSRDGLRDGVLLAKGFGVSRQQVLEAISWGSFCVGEDALGMAEQVAGPILDDWP